MKVYPSVAQQQTVSIPQKLSQEAKNGDDGESSADWRGAESSVNSKLCNEGAFVFPCGQKAKNTLNAWQ